MPGKTGRALLIHRLNGAIGNDALKAAIYRTSAEDAGFLAKALEAKCQADRTADRNPIRPYMSSNQHRLGLTKDLGHLDENLGNRAPGNIIRQVVGKIILYRIKGHQLSPIGTRISNVESMLFDLPGAVIAGQSANRP